MFARRFRLDKAGNLYADGLFCRPILLDPDILAEGKIWADAHIQDVRTSKANAIVGFERAWADGDQQEAYVLARQVHTLMLAQRLANVRRASITICD